MKRKCPSLKQVTPRDKSAAGAKKISRAELAKSLDVDDRSISRWLQDGCPSHGEGRERRFIEADVRAWLLGKGRTPGKGPGRPGILDAIAAGLPQSVKDQLAAEELRWKKARAARAEIIAAQLAGRLVERDEVERGRVERAAWVRNAVMALPGRAAPHLVGVADPREVERRLRVEVEAMLGEMSRG